MAAIPPINQISQQQTTQYENYFRQVSYCMSKRKHSASSFQEDWLTDVCYKLWIRRVKNDQKKAYCILCKRTIDLETGGITAVNSHQGGKRHGDRLKERKKNESRSFFGGGTSLSSTDNGNAGDAGDAHDVGAPGTSSQSFLPYDVDNEVTDAEILWCLYMVENHLSYRSNDQLPKLLQRMFRADPVAAKFSMQKDKSRYLVIYGIYPVFQDNLIKEISMSPWFGVSFDESFNKQQQKCQMDVNIRFWNDHKKIVESAYLTSRMLMRPNAPNLLDEILISIKELDKNKFLHLAMDGPSTNWKVLDLLDGTLCDGGFTKTINIGSCSLHILHGAFGTGIVLTEWKLGKVIKAMFKLLNESPARREIYLKEGDSGKFPQSFCETRWIEDEPVADRALEVWPSIIALIKHFEGLCKSKRPRNNKSYETLVGNYLDPLVPTKLHFFCFFAKILQPYLVMFQTDAPMVPFMFDELSSILYRLCRCVYRKKKMDQVKTLRELMTEDFLKKEKNQMDEMQVDIGAAAKDSLNKVNVSAEKKRQFRKECRGAIINTLLKLLERLPTNKAIVVSASALNPQNMINHCIIAAKRFNALADSLYSLKKITSSVADNAKHQFSKFQDNEVKREGDKFVAFNFRKDRLDEFYYPLIGTTPEYADLWRICQLVFILNHGQAFTERGFSINKLTSDTNMKDNSLIAQRLIYDTIKKIGDISTFPISQQLRRSCRSAKSQMLLDNEKKNQEIVKGDRELKRTAKREEIDTLKKSKLDLVESISTLKSELTKAAIASGTNGNKVRENAVKAAAFAKEMVAKEATMKELEGFEKKLEDEYKALQM